ncbi:unnamed protein product [Rhizophagus irregularis]|nr:unnamed protein product [Rhizophagus irregularis]
MINSSLESSNRDESNGNKSRFIAPRKMILPPFYSSRLDDSKELLIIFLRSLDAEKLSKTFSASDRRKMKLVLLPEELSTRFNGCPMEMIGYWHDDASQEVEGCLAV